MRVVPFTSVLVGVLTGAPLGGGGPAHAAAVDAEVIVLLEARCVRCHNPAEKKGGLDLTTRAGLLAGGETGPAVVSGSPETSPLYQMITHEESPGMPLREDKLSDADIAVVARWITEGLPYARPLHVPEAPVHWAFAPLAAFARGTTLDGLVKARLAHTGLSLSPPLSPAARVRRLSFDVRGLPPDASEQAAFVRAPTAAGWRRLVARSLASPDYGERWGQHWLDVARYADSGGFEADPDRKTAYPYRDFVIRALNADMPFTTFLSWQIAGDELAPGEPDAVAATGFLAAGEALMPIATDTDENKRRYRADEVDDWVSTVGSAFLGLTVGCARCHDHKFDPISTREYYQMAATFVMTRRDELPLDEARRRFEVEKEDVRAAWREARMKALHIPDYDRIVLRSPLMPNNPTSVRIHEQWAPQLVATEQDLVAWLPPEARRRWHDKQRAALQAEADPALANLPKAFVIRDDSGPARPAFLLRRGDVRTPAGEVSPGFLKILGGDRLERYQISTEGGAGRRAALARWLIDVEHGAGRLVARVLANRLWQHHFGHGLVDTPNDFGTQTERPVQLDVLDFLAQAIIRNGWRLKQVHRIILASRVYQQGDTADAHARAVDPRNRLWGRREPRRLEAEAVRDALLAASGTLNHRRFGPAVKPAIPRAATATRSRDGYPADTPDAVAAWRRSIYVFAKRSVPNPLFEVFDRPALTASCGRRAVTTVPTQALALMNDEFVRARARDLAVRAEAEAGDREGERMNLVFQWILNRPPTAEEREDARAFRSGPHARTGVAPPAADVRTTALADLAHALFMTNEFIHVD